MAKDTGKAYRGYLIRSNPISGLLWIEKGGAFIAWAHTMLEAENTIRELTA